MSKNAVCLLVVLGMFSGDVLRPNRFISLQLRLTRRPRSSDRVQDRGEGGILLLDCPSG